ncbi:polyhydroxyalkanoate depolymerase [Pontivivens nitratireducens]|uniref:polyhydroxyalkanoate depolymerase n=1 Tax=Pontivivens nitratireducens TaxID=2758038 RepID=UPI00201C0A43|nr:polyhydroxyalkanoate depolymerase [Pontibrevibacter nitratireducens]
MQTKNDEGQAMLYHAYEYTHAAMGPMRQAARMGQQMLTSPFNPMVSTYQARATAAACEMFINATRRYGKPEFGIDTVELNGKTLDVVESVPFALPFCDLLHMSKPDAPADQTPVLIVAPMSGHYATLLRGTVRQMLPDHDVYVTDWVDARDVPLSEGRFDLDDYTDYVMEQCRYIAKVTGERPAVLAVCQPGVPVLVAASLMAEDGDPARPASVTLMGSPIDVTKNPKQPNELATGRPLSWFENNVIVTVPFPNKGYMRRVYPGFLQLSGFMSMNMDRHVDAHVKQFRNLIKGDGDSAEQHRTFYDEYNAVMDMTAEFYLQTIERVFQKGLLATGEYMYRDRLVEPSAITDIALMTIEGEMDDITGLGQTEAAHTLATNLPDDKRAHYVQAKVGHYGVFNGSRWRQFIQPKVAEFMQAQRAPFA